MHVQSCCFFTHKTISFLTFWLPASSLQLLKFLIDWNPSTNPPLTSLHKGPLEKIARREHREGRREKKNLFYALIVDVTEVFHKLSRD